MEHRVLPPVDAKAELVDALKYNVRRDEVDEAIQEAWVAYLEGKDAVAAVRAFGIREKRHRKKFASGGVVDELLGETEDE